MKRRLTASARRDITVILRRSRQDFGEVAEQRYKRLIRRGLAVITADDGPRGAGFLDEAEDVRIYHLRNCRNDLDGAVARPRHVLLYRFVSSELIEVLRVVDNRMDLVARVDELQR